VLVMVGGLGAAGRKHHGVNQDGCVLTGEGRRRCRSRRCRPPVRTVMLAVRRRCDPVASGMTARACARCLDGDGGVTGGGGREEPFVAS
jgi:hypothetical protein